MQAQSGTPVRTFTIGFNEAQYNEAEHAKAVARHLGTDHTELYVTPQEALDVIPRLPAIYDEPFADSSQVPTFLVAQLARRHVTVSLSGEGGDELFAGYNRYFWGERIWRRMRTIPRPARAALGRSLQAVSPAGWDSAFGAASRVLPRHLHAARPGNKVHKVASFMGAESPDALYRGVMTHWRDPRGITGVAEPVTALTRTSGHPRFTNVVNRMRYFDLVSELPDDILVKVDRAAMAVSLESRAPFLHHDVVEFAWRIPPSQLVRDGQGKWLLRQVLYRYVPRALIERPKMGFGVPIDVWLRGPLREWAADLLAPDRLRREGYLAPEPITRAWDDHQAGRTDNSHLLWGVLMFQAWLETR
jgi:asparagine synthase (glutamine-hydrolysing)